MNERQSRPIEIKLHAKSGVLEVAFDNGAQFEFSCEYLRIHSPSAEVHRHGAGEPLLVTGKKDVKITEIEPVGNYAVRLVFDDGHSTGLYSWKVLYELGIHQERNWQRYLERLEEEGASRQN